MMLFPIFHDHPDMGSGWECVGCFWYWLIPLLLLPIPFVVTLAVLAP